MMMMFLALVLASSSLTDWRRSWAIAIYNGVWPALFLTLASAPCFNSNVTMSALLSPAAKCSGKSPSWFRSLTRASAAINNSANIGIPRLAAM